MKQQTARDFHIDNIKGVLIFLVVLGHMLGYLQETHSAFATGVRTFIYFFPHAGVYLHVGLFGKGLSRRNIRRKSCSPSHGSIFCSRMSSSWCISSLNDHILKQHTTLPSGLSLFCCSAAAFGCSLFAYSKSALFRKAFILAF